MKVILSIVGAISCQILFAQQTFLFPVNIDEKPDSVNVMFDEVKSLILDKYYTTEITEDDLYWAAIQGMLRHISPPENPDLATLWTPEAYEKILNSLKGVEISLGIKSSFDSNTGSLTVTTIEENSPAQGALQLYDRILRIDGTNLKGLTLNEIDQLLNGEPNTEVSLTINRDLEIFDVILMRQNFEVTNLKVTQIPSSDVALVEIHKIYQGLTEELDLELQKISQQGINRIILDLRHNTGGVLNEGVRVSNLFLKPNNIIIRTLSRSNEAKPIVADKPDGYSFDMVVLIDEKTASASEIVVSALRDHKRATIIGTKTYGKGVIETTFTLSNEYRCKFITSAMYSPAGVSWQAKGILPDILVEQDDNAYYKYANMPISTRIRNDIYLITALKLL
jgi:carboxyl-terminal processing protease